MVSAEYVSRKKAIRGAQVAMRTSFGADVRFEPVPRSSPFPRIFRVLDNMGHEVQNFRVFKVGIGLQEWAWEEAAPRS
jgi:hypothetical protein